MKYRRFRMQDVLREEISSIIQQEIKDPGIGFITILDVKMTEDLKYAKVLYSVYGSDEERAKTVEALRRAKGYIKHVLGNEDQAQVHAGDNVRPRHGPGEARQDRRDTEAGEDREGRECSRRLRKQ